MEINIINQMLSEAKRLGTAVVWDKGMGYVKIIKQHSLQNFTPNLFLAGPVFPVETKGEILPVLQGLNKVPEGSVLLIKDYCQKKALLGDIVMLAAKQKNLSGIVCLGGVRDVAEASILELPVWALFCSPMAASLGKINRDTHYTKSISIGDVSFDLGDWIFGDMDGMLYVPKEHARLIIKSASIKNKKEEMYKKRIIAGEDIIKMMNIEGHILRDEPIIVEF
ncbi:RraA family protein [Neisseria sp.]|uniref:RraA family protein n=1 Tax=Neisseria sp. TaxID=192066 RepID=UPI0026DD3F80|nr:RraA family protein [Neisseria sp.]MDO4907121.1 RraA family protein [Neisseria sp.]